MSGDLPAVVVRRPKTSSVGRGWLEQTSALRCVPCR